MNGFTLLIGSAVIFLIAYVVMAPGLPSNGASTRRAKHRQKLRRTALTTFRQNRLFSSDTTSLQLQAPDRLSVHYGCCLRLGSRHTVDYCRQRLLRRRT